VLSLPAAAPGSHISQSSGGAQVCAIRLAGFPTVGIAGGNIVESGTRALCDFYADTSEEMLQVPG